MKWADVDLQEGVWTKPGSTTKQKTIHRVPLSAPARQLLSTLYNEAKAAAEDKKKPRPMSGYVFPGRGKEGFRHEIKHQWADLCLSAGLVTAKVVKDAKGHERTVMRATARLHDLRHTYASVLASAGLSLPVIGALLGHSQPATTARYSHLMDDPLRQATERVGSIVMPPAQAGQIVPMDGRSRQIAN
jgi:integrase